MLVYSVDMIYHPMNIWPSIDPLKSDIDGIFLLCFLGTLHWFLCENSRKENDIIVFLGESCLAILASLPMLVEHAYCQTQPQPQLHLSWVGIALISQQIVPPTLTRLVVWGLYMTVHDLLMTYWQQDSIQLSQNRRKLWLWLWLLLFLLMFCVAFGQ